MLDINHADAVAVGKSRALVERLRALPLEAWCISAVTYSELHYGLEKGSPRRPVQLAVRTFLDLAPVAAWDSSAGAGYGRLRAANGRTGQRMGVFDEMIAAHALALELTLLTGDRAFERVPGLHLENWLE
jgi:tRNA(fMet)-specific endonuclease VapC